MTNLIGQYQEEGNKGKNKGEKNRHREFNVVRRTMCMPTSTTTLGSICISGVS